MGIGIAEEQSAFLCKTEVGNLRIWPAWSLQETRARPVKTGNREEEMGPLMGLCDEH